MDDNDRGPSALEPYRVLDLTDEKGMLCGRILGDLGADVIKVEKPGGDSSRDIGPFFHDERHPEKSLFWFAYNANKRGITLDLENGRDRDRFLRLVSTAHFVIESFPPGYLDRLGLGYPTLSSLNPSIILVSITPFGQTGPYRDFKSSDIVAMAMGGLMYVTGDPDRPPVRVSVGQAYLHAGAHAAIGALLAHHHHEATGKGQQVDISIQESVVPSIPEVLPYWQFDRYKLVRSGSYIYRGRAWQRAAWPCKDGQIGMRILTGVYAGAIKPLIEWMKEEGMAGELDDVAWAEIDVSTITQQEYDSWEKRFIKFFLGHTKKELYQEALRRGIHLLPAYGPDELLTEDQLIARHYWRELEHPELGASIVYPGPFAQFSLTPCQIRRRAPLIGEHNLEVLREIDTGKAGVDSRWADRAAGGPLQRHQALQGLKVLDLSVSVVGPYVSTYLGDFGADVVKVETNLKPDICRVSTPYKDGVDGVNRSGLFNTVNRNKLSMALNLNHPRHREVTDRLIEWADVVIESFTVGVKERWQLDYESISKRNPGIIMLSTTSQGQTGPCCRHPGWGWSMKSLCGFTQLTGWPDREEGAAPAPSYTDEVSPWFAVVSILAALDYRRRTGRGQFIDHSQVEASLHFLSPAILDCSANGRRQSRRANLSSRACPHGCYRCRGDDRWCVIAVFTDHEWEKFRQAMGNPAWGKDPRFATFQGRKAHEAEIDRLVEQWTTEREPQELMLTLQAFGVAAGAVQDEEDILDHDLQLKHRRFFPETEHVEAGRFRQMGLPVRLNLTPARPGRTPCLGEDTEHVCSSLLGMSAAEFVELLQSGLFT